MQQGLRKARVEPSNDLWSKIEGDLDSHDKKEGYFLWQMRWSVAALLVIALGSTIYFGTENPNGLEGTTLAEATVQGPVIPIQEGQANNGSLISEETEFSQEFESSNLTSSQPRSLNASMNIESKPSSVQKASIRNERVVEERIALSSLVVEELAVQDNQFESLSNSIDIILNGAYDMAIESLQEADADDDEWLVFEDSDVKTSKWEAIAGFAPVYSEFHEGAPQQIESLGAVSNKTVSKAESSYQVESSLTRAFNTGFQVGKQISPKLQVMTGMTYSDLSGEVLAAYQVEQTTTEFITSYMPVPAGAGGSSHDLIEVSEEVITTRTVQDTATHRFNYRFVEIPLTVRYGIGTRRVSGFLESGISANLGGSYSEGASLNSVPEDNSTGSFSNTFVPSHLNLLVGVGAKYNLTENLSVSMTPRYRYGIKTIDNATFDSNHATWSLFTGIGFRF